MKKWMLLLLLCSNGAVAEGFHYCSGQVTDLITRPSHEETKLKIEGLGGFAKIGWGGDAYKEMHERQFSMILAAYMSGKPVVLEFVDSAKDCSDDHEDDLIRYVRLR